MPGPAIFQDDLVIALEQIPTVIGILPGAAAFERIATPRGKLARKAVSIAAAMAWVIVEIGVAIEHEVGGDEGPIVFIAITQTNLQAGVAVVVKDALLDEVAAAFDFHAVITGSVNFQTFEMPKMRIGL